MHNYLRVSGRGLTGGIPLVILKESRGDPTALQTMFKRIFNTETFNPALGFATCLEENVETIGAKGGFWIEKVTVRQAAVDGLHNTWTKRVETRFVLRDMATNELQISGTLDRCFAHIDAKLLAA